MNIARFMTLFSLCICLFAACPAAYTQQPKQRPASSSTTNSQFGAEEHVGVYRIKPPLLFSVKSSERQGAVEMYIWKPQLGRALLSVAVNPNPIGSRATVTPQLMKLQYQAAVLGMSASIGLKNFRQDQGPSRSVAINGINFERGRWSGTDSHQTLNYGFTYFCVIGENQIVITGLSNDTKLFQLAESSAVTFRR